MIFLSFYVTHLIFVEQKVTIRRISNQQLTIDFTDTCAVHIFTGRNEVVAKVMFLLMSVILLTGGGSASMHAGIPPPPTKQTPPGADTPPPPGAETPPGAEPQSRHPQEQTPLERRPPPLGADTPQEQTPPGSRPPWEADSRIRSMSGLLECILVWKYSVAVFRWRKELNWNIFGLYNVITLFSWTFFINKQLIFLS